MTLRGKTFRLNLLFFMKARDQQNGKKTFDFHYVCLKKTLFIHDFIIFMEERRGRNPSFTGNFEKKNQKEIYER